MEWVANMWLGNVRAQLAASKPRPEENFTFTVHELATAAQL